MAETDHHRQIMTDVIGQLEDRYQGRPDVYVSGNLLLFYQEGDRRKHVSPDAFVAFGIPKRKRLNYLLWEEGKAPNVVFEITSKTTRREDVSKKRELYRDVLKVPEYFLFDPFGDYLKPGLQGFRLVDGEYQAIPFQDGRLRSRQLDLWLEADGDELRLVDVDTGKRLPTRAERLQGEVQARREAETHAREADARAQQLADEVERLRAMLHNQGSGSGRNGH